MTKIGQVLIKLLNDNYNIMEKTKSGCKIIIREIEKANSKFEIEISKQLMSTEYVKFIFTLDISYNEFDDILIKYVKIHGLQEIMPNQCIIDSTEITKKEHEEINFLLGMIYNRYYEFKELKKKEYNRKELDKILERMENTQ